MNQYRTATIPSFTIGEMKRMAKKQLSGKWLRLLPLMLIYTLLTTVPAVVIQLNSYMTQTSQLNSMLASEGSATSEMISDMLTSMQTSPAAGMTTFGLIASALALYTFLTAGAFSVSLSGLSLRILRNEPFSVRTIFAGFTQYGKAFIANLLVSIFSVLWALLFILPGSFFLGMGTVSGSPIATFLSFMVFTGLLLAAVIFLMRYQMTFFIAADEDCTGSECVSRSVRLMKGNISNFFLLQLSFLPWILLLCVPVGLAAGAAFTAVSASSSSAAIFPAVLAVIFGIVSLFGEMLLILYMQTASAVFYSGATGNFRSSGSGGQSMPEDKIPQDISGPSNTSGLQNPDTPKDAEPAALTGSRPSGGAKTSGTASAEPDTDSPSDSDSDSDETLSILESDDSLDHLYDEEEK